jgi:hypothetical protein
VALDEELRKRREEVCLGHMAAEYAHRFDEAIGFFARPRCEFMATGEVFDGKPELGGLMHENVTAFPDFRFDSQWVHHADEAIVVEACSRARTKAPGAGCRQPAARWRSPCSSSSHSMAPR